MLRPAPAENSPDASVYIYDLRTEAGLSQRELAVRMGTTQLATTSPTTPLAGLALAGQR
jgi:hypothetical protein